MRQHSLRHLTNEILIRDLNALVVSDRATTAALVAHLSEVDARRLCRPLGYSSMFQYCIRGLGMSEDIAWRRTATARLARRFPRILTALADGRLHVSGVALLKDYLTERNADDLLSAIEHKTRREIERLLAERFPKPDVPTRVRAIIATTAASAPAEAQSDSSTEPSYSVSESELLLAAQDQVLDSNSSSLPALVRATVTMPEQATASVGISAPQPKLTPLAPERFALQVTIDRETHDALRRAQELITHPTDVADVIKRALGLLVTQLEKRKYAAASKPRPTKSRPSADPRHIPAHVRRAVRERDQDQCTFESESGVRCTERSGLEFDHVQEFARGGEATVNNLQLRCRAHNQYTAERTFGARFMDEKRREAQEAAAARQAARAQANKLSGAKALSPSAPRTKPEIPRMTLEEMARGAANARAVIRALEAQDPPPL